MSYPTYTTFNHVPLWYDRRQPDGSDYGHGDIDAAYIQFPNGQIIRGDEALRWFRDWSGR